MLLVIGRTDLFTYYLFGTVVSIDGLFEICPRLFLELLITNIATILPFETFIPRYTGIMSTSAGVDFFKFFIFCRKKTANNIRYITSTKPTRQFLLN